MAVMWRRLVRRLWQLSQSARPCLQPAGMAAGRGAPVLIKGMTWQLHRAFSWPEIRYTATSSCK